MQKETEICDVCQINPAIVRDNGKSYCGYLCYMSIPDRRWFELLDLQKEKSTVRNAEAERAKLHKVK